MQTPCVHASPCKQKGAARLRAAASPPAFAWMSWQTVFLDTMDRACSGPGHSLASVVHTVPQSSTAEKPLSAQKLPTDICRMMVFGCTHTPALARRDTSRGCAAPAGFVRGAHRRPLLELAWAQRLSVIFFCSERELGPVVIGVDGGDEGVEGEEAIEEEQDPEEADGGEVEGEEGGVLLDVPGKGAEEGKELSGARLGLGKLAKEEALAALQRDVPARRRAGLECAI